MTGKQRASAFSYSQAVKAGKAKQAAYISNEDLNFPGPKGFVLNFPDPEPATQGTATAAASGASSSAEAAPSSAGGRAVPKKAAKVRPVQPSQEREPIQLLACEAALVKSAALGHKLTKDLAAGRARTGRGGWQFAGKGLSEYMHCLSEGPAHNPRKLFEAVTQRFSILEQRADQLCAEGNFKGVPCPVQPFLLLVHSDYEPSVHHCGADCEETGGTVQPSASALSDAVTTHSKTAAEWLQLGRHQECTSHTSSFSCSCGVHIKVAPM